MAITAIDSSTSALATNSMGMEDFLKILMAQLTFQDPMKPMDNQEFMAQMAQFTSLEQTQQMNDKLSQLITNQAALQSVGLIGRTVDIQNAGGVMSTGTVSSLSLSGAAPVISLTTTGGVELANIGLQQIVAVR